LIGSKGERLLEARALGLWYRGEEGRGRRVFQGIDLDIERGEFVAVLGPSGCGKTSLLKTLGGFISPSTGRVLFQGRRLNGPCPEAVMVFQEFDQLFPWKRVWSNVVFPIKVGGDVHRREAMEGRAENILAELGLTDYLRYFPHQLSGGMKQRAALARALVSGASLLLMDEPFGSLDAQRREEMQRLLLRMWEEHGFSAIFVTHDIGEAISLADRILVMVPDGEEWGGGYRLHELPVKLSRPRSSVDAGFLELYQEIYSYLSTASPESGRTR